MKKFGLVLSLIILLFCQQASLAYFEAWTQSIGLRKNAHKENAAALQILMLGNSLTYYNNGPGMLATMLKHADPGIGFNIISGLWPGISLTRTSQKKDVKELLTQKWNYVFLQEFSGEAFKGSDAVEKGLNTVVPAVNNGSTKVFCVMTFADKTSYFHQSIISQSYKDASEELKVPYIPVGNMFFYVEETNPRINLYDADNHHPSAQGTYLYMLAVCKELLSKDKFQKLKSFTPQGMHSDIAQALFKCVDNWEQIEKSHPEFSANVPGSREDIADYWLSHGRAKQAEELLLRRLKDIDQKTPDAKTLSAGHTLMSLAKAQMELNTPEKNALAHDNLVRAEQIFLKLEGVNGATARRIKQVLEH